MIDDDEIVSTDGHVYRSPEEQERELLFIRDEGRPLLTFYQQINDLAVREAFRDLMKAVAFAYSKKK